MQYTIEELRACVFKDVYEVYEIFKNFFGEEYTDLQGVPDIKTFNRRVTGSSNIVPDHVYSYTQEQIDDLRQGFTGINILVWWPEVTVTNENDRSIKIQDLYARIGITIEGRIPYENRGFELTRTTFSHTQYTSGYMHSHVPSLRGIPTFKDPCLGRGPIINTILDLKNSSNEITWMLFCQELSQYVTVESLTGGPYIKLESVGTSLRQLPLPTEEYTILSESCLPFRELVDSAVIETQELIVALFKEFIKYYLKKCHLSFGFNGTHFTLGTQPYDAIIEMSNLFIDFVNKRNDSSIVEKLWEKEIIRKVVIKDRKLYAVSDNARTAQEYENAPVLVFKREQKRLHIFSTPSDATETVVLDTLVFLYIVDKILKVINYYYGENNDRQLSDNDNTATTSKTICYI